MTPRPLFTLLERPEALLHDGFRARVAALAASLTGCPSAALACKDSESFAIGLFALLHVGTEVILPPNCQPGTLAGLDGPIVDDETVRAACPCPMGAAAVLPPIPPDAAVTFFTSGSTGQPKRIRRSLAMLEREVVLLEEQWGSQLAQSPVLAMVSHQHLFGLTFKILWPLAAGRSFDPGTHDLWEGLIEALPERAVLISSPAHLSRMGGIAPLPLAKRPAAVFSAGAPLSLEASQQAEAILGCRPFEIFGSTETGAVATRSQSSTDADWRLLPGHDLLPHPEGLLKLTSPYDGQTIETADLIEPRPGGFRFLGRADRIAKIAGKRVALAEVEAALASLPWVESAAAVFLPPPIERLGAVLILTAEGKEKLASQGSFRFSRLLRRDLSAGLDPAAIPKLWRFVENLPHHPMGKRKSADLLALFAEEAAL